MSAATLSISLDHHARQPIYLQLQDALRSLIQQGRLQKGERLPSSRELAQALGISRTSSLKAYDNLIAEGFLLSAAKRGVFVAQNLPVIELQSLPVSVFPKPEKPMLGFDSVANVETFPARQWASCLRRSWLKPDAGLMMGEYPSGWPLLKQRVADYLRDLRGLDCLAEQVLITAGNRDALTILVQALMMPNNAIWLENPCYAQMASLFTLLGKPLHALPLDDEGATVPQTCHGMAVITPNRQYPLGIVMSPQRRQAWLDQQQAMREQGKRLWLIEDDYDSEFVYQGRTHVPLMQLDRQQGTFFVGSFSKVLFRGLRLGFIVAPPQQVRRLMDSQYFLGSSSALGMQPALAEFMATGGFASHLRKMRRFYLAQRDHLLHALDGLSTWLQWEKNTGGMHLVAYLREPWQGKHASGLAWDKLVAQRAEQLGLKLNCLSSHYFTGSRVNGFILGYSQRDERQMSQAIGLFKLCLKEVLSAPAR
ncbi:PLP-dependent aminotransferase family protein [Bowmanella yangjiangensis]|uniref:PLP-dependent aminotransferase family protein n=1 Tax=Bowmanella yangjiangensis TaxID=2811230 RepID=A0ABS3CTI8_9ALTE|nr:PLP-dependent aminotransferase family protein [Bowmanella yangjiangensis]MBN7819451.1 PLP-dependent aminotransferase family protein [Bowmanella yangjiangensis]